MDKPSVKCALLAAMLAKHRWGSPITEEYLLAIAAIESNDYRVASRMFEDLRSVPYTVNRGMRGIELDTGEFGRLAEILYRECNWDPFEIKSRLKHYEGWDRHEWA